MRLSRMRSRCSAERALRVTSSSKVRFMSSIIAESEPRHGSPAPRTERGVDALLFAAQLRETEAVGEPLGRVDGQAQRVAGRRTPRAAPSAAEVVVLPTPPEPTHTTTRWAATTSRKFMAGQSGPPRSSLSRLEIDRMRFRVFGPSRRPWVGLQATTTYIGASMRTAYRAATSERRTRRSEHHDLALRYQLESTLTRGRMAALALTDGSRPPAGVGRRGRRVRGARRRRADDRAGLAARARARQPSAATTSPCARSSASASSSTWHRSAAASRAKRCSRTPRAASTGS